MSCFGGYSHDSKAYHYNLKPSSTGPDIPLTGVFVFFSCSF